MATTTMIILGLALFSTACGSDKDSDPDTETERLMSGAPSILVDLDPSSTGTTVTVESITADPAGKLFVSDRESGNVLAIDPAAPSPVIVGKLAERTDPATNMPVKANGAGLVFAPNGDLLIASGSFNEVLRLTAAELRASAPAVAQTFITGVRGANSVLLVGELLYVSGGATGNVYVAPASGGAAQVWAQIAPSTRSVPPDSYMQSVVANGLARDPSGAVLVADTTRAAIWRIPVNADGSPATPETMIQATSLEGVDGLMFDPRGRLWAAVNEHNALVVVKDGQVESAFENGNTGPLEFPAALVFVGNTGYVANFDRARALNFAADGTTSSAGIGSSIARFQL
jgi:SMP-30/Gluconolactonase/LRE-like region